MELPLSKNQKLYILIGVSGVIILILYYSLLLRPLWAGFIAKNREYVVLKLRVKKAIALIANEAKIRRDYEDVKKRSNDVLEMLPSQDKIASLLEDFSAVAESSGVKILKLKPLEETASGLKAKDANIGYSEFPILIEARAGYHQFGDFVNKLENMKRFIKIIDLDIKGDAEDIRRHNIKMKILTYVLK